jgi:hypothetical protein
MKKPGKGNKLLYVEERIGLEVINLKPFVKETMPRTNFC